MKPVKFSKEDIIVLNKEDYLLKEEDFLAVFTGDQKLYLREIRKTNLDLYEIHFYKKNPEGELSIVEKICNEFSFKFMSLTKAINYLKRQ